MVLERRRDDPRRPKARSRSRALDASERWGSGWHHGLLGTAAVDSALDGTGQSRSSPPSTSGTNAVRLELARPLPDGSLETAPPGARSRSARARASSAPASSPRAVADRLLSTLRRYARALPPLPGPGPRGGHQRGPRGARTATRVVARVRARGRARARGRLRQGGGAAHLPRACCAGSPRAPAPWCIDIGGGSTEIAAARRRHARRASGAWPSARCGSPSSSSSMGKRAPEAAHAHAQLRRRGLPRVAPARIAGTPRRALGSSGTIGAIVAFAAESGERRPRRERHPAGGRGPGGDGARRSGASASTPGAAEIIVAGAVILEALMRHLGLETVTAVETGPPRGHPRRPAAPHGRSAADAQPGEAALALGRRFALRRGARRRR